MTTSHHINQIGFKRLASNYYKDVVYMPTTMFPFPVACYRFSLDFNLCGRCCYSQSLISQSFILTSLTRVNTFILFVLHCVVLHRVQEYVFIALSNQKHGVGVHLDDIIQFVINLQMLTLYIL